MKEYRIRAYFTEVYRPRSYKGKVFTSLEDAEKYYSEAKDYYSGSQYIDRLEKLVIEQRKVGRWKKREN